MKSMSYGHLGMTNSVEVYNEMEGHCIFESNTNLLFYKAMDNRSNFNFIKNGMKYIKENHTYINRIKSIMKVI